ncbi:MAG: ArsR/SmtB family transcription factor [Solirubrobacteraceae bacterium]
MGATARAESAEYPPEAHWEECPAAEDLELPAVLHALSDPMRMRIVASLAQEGEQACKDFDLPIVKSTCAHHFRVLRECGVIRQRVVGNTRINSLRRAELDERFPGLLNAVLAGTEQFPAAV